MKTVIKAPSIGTLVFFAAPPPPTAAPSPLYNAKRPQEKKGASVLGLM